MGKLKRSHVFLVIGLLGIWFCFFVVLRNDEPDQTGVGGKEGGMKLRHPAEGTVAVEPERDVLEAQPEVFSFAYLDMKSLNLILNDKLGLDIDYPKELDSVEFENVEYDGALLSEILIDLLKPRGYGFYRQGKTIHLIKLEKASAAEEASDGNVAATECSWQAAPRVATGEPVDVWIGNSPLQRLRFTVLPLFGEGVENQAVVTVDAQRNQRPWFRHSLETELGEKMEIAAKGMNTMRCDVTLENLENSEITLEVDYHYESSSPES